MSQDGGAQRIGFDAIRALRNTTGLGNYSRGLLRSLRDHDRQLAIHLYCPKPPRPEYRDLPADLDATLHLPGGAHPSGLRPQASGHRPQASGLRPQALWRPFRLGRDALRDNIQLYHGLSHEIPRDLPGTGIPSVVTFHDLIFERHPALFSLPDRISYRWRYRWSARHANLIIAVSARTRDDLIQLYRVDPARIVVIPPVRDPVFATPIDQAARASVRARYHLPDRYLLSVGTLEARKNHRVLVSSIAELPGSGPILVLVGRDGRSLAALRALTARLRVEDRVRILTDVPAGDLPALVQSASIFLYPSVIEGFGMPIVEALSAGVPVIASRGGHLDEAGGPLTRYVTADDAGAWSAAIRDVLENPALAEQMRIGGLDHAQQFNGATVAIQVMAAYQKVMGAR